MLTFIGKYVKEAKVMIDDIDDMTRSQIIQFINHPAMCDPVRIMPDTHAGIGAVVGMTAKLSMTGDGELLDYKVRVIPAMVGRDINCGVLGQNIGKLLFSRMRKEDIEHQIRRSIPMGKNTRKDSITGFNIETDNKFWQNCQERVELFIIKYNKEFNYKYNIPEINYKWFIQKCKQIDVKLHRAVLSIGTLGGGNHFIEIDKSEETGDYWIVIHSGSRQFGGDLCNYWQKEAKNKAFNMSKFRHDQSLILDDNLNLDKRELLFADLKIKYERIKNIPVGTYWLEDNELVDYLIDSIVAGQYAMYNRLAMMAHIIDQLDLENDINDEMIHTNHNNIDFTDFIIRKGAVRANKDELFLLPFNMEDGTLICKGKGNEDWNYSAPHGAGRVASRSTMNSKKLAKMAKDRMLSNGIYVTTVPDDEVKEAYKAMNIITDAIEPTADIIDSLKPKIILKDK